MGNTQNYTVEFTTQPRQLDIDGLKEARPSWEESIAHLDERTRESLEGFYEIFWVTAFIRGADHFARKLGYKGEMYDLKKKEGEHVG